MIMTKFDLLPFGQYGNILAPGNSGVQATFYFLNAMGLFPLKFISKHHEEGYVYNHADLQLICWTSRMPNGSLREKDAVRCLVRYSDTKKKIGLQTVHISRDFKHDGILTEIALRKCIPILIDVMKTREPCRYCKSPMLFKIGKAPQDIPDAHTMQWYCSKNNCYYAQCLPIDIEKDVIAICNEFKTKKRAKNK